MRFLHGFSIAAAALFFPVWGMSQDLKYIGANADRGYCEAVVVGDVALVHTAQLLPVDSQGNLVQDDVFGQIRQVMLNIDAALSAAQCTADQLVKLNFYVADQRASVAVEKFLTLRFSSKRKPAVSFVATKLPLGASVAADAVAMAGGERPQSVGMPHAAGIHGSIGAAASVTPPGTRIYIAGQAEKGANLAEATRKTLESLQSTLRFLGRQDRDIAQLKAFLSPMSDVDVVKKEMAAVFGPEKVPPLVFVEWKAPLIEIELVAWGGDHNSGPVVEYLTPPGMSASPIYSRVARINSTPSIYTSGLFAHEGNAAAETTDVFEQLRQLLKETGSDYKHLAKATYYCATDASSKQLNETRPGLYDPQRPPSASKAMVIGVGREQRALTLDMIAVPAWDNAASEYGPSETGLGLTKEQAGQGWISLCDAKSTFGWRGAQIDEHGLFGGMTTCAFGACTVDIDVARPGSISKGTKTIPVTNQQTIMFADGVNPIQLDDTIRVKSLHLQPLNLRSIFDGRQLTDWKRIDHPSLPENRWPTWSVSNGVLHATGGPGAMEFTGQLFGDFVLQVDVRTAIRHANGGVFVRSIPGDFMNGYEAQIYNRALDGDPSRPARYSTGALDDRQLARRLVSRDNEFFTMTVIANGAHLATWVDGAQLTDWTDDRPPHENPRMGLRTAAGSIQLQAHDAGTAVDFGPIRIVELK